MDTSEIKLADDTQEVIINKTSPDVSLVESHHIDSCSLAMFIPVLSIRELFPLIKHHIDTAYKQCVWFIRLDWIPCDSVWFLLSFFLV